MTYVTNIQRPVQLSGAASRAVQPVENPWHKKTTSHLPGSHKQAVSTLDLTHARVAQGRPTQLLRGWSCALCADVLTKAISRKAQEIGMGIGCVHLTLFLCL